MRSLLRTPDILSPGERERLGTVSGPQVSILFIYIKVCVCVGGLEAILLPLAWYCCNSYVLALLHLGILSSWYQRMLIINLAPVESRNTMTAISWFMSCITTMSQGCRKQL